MIRREFLKSEILLALQAAVSEFQRIEGTVLISAVLFGSGAKKGVKPESDLDVLFVFETLPLKKEIREDLLWPAIKASGNHFKILQANGLTRSLSPVFKTHQEALVWSPLYLDMTEHHVLLADQGQFMAGILKRVGAWIATSGSLKIQRGLKWYWKLEGDPSQLCHLQNEEKGAF